METKRVIELKNVSIYQGEVSRKANAENNLVLSNVNLTVDEGEFVYLIGRVGTGKSTLLKTLYARWTSSRVRLRLWASTCAISSVAASPCCAALWVSSSRTFSCSPTAMSS